MGRVRRVAVPVDVRMRAWFLEGKVGLVVVVMMGGGGYGEY